MNFPPVAHHTHAIEAVCLSYFGLYLPTPLNDASRAACVEAACELMPELTGHFLATAQRLLRERYGVELPVVITARVGDAPPPEAPAEAPKTKRAPRTTKPNDTEPAPAAPPVVAPVAATLLAGDSQPHGDSLSSHSIGDQGDGA